MWNRSTSWTRSFLGSVMSHARHSSLHAAVWRARASAKPGYRRADLPALPSGSLIARSLEL